MQTFKKVLASGLLFIFLFVVISEAFIGAFVKSDFYYYNDAGARKECAGTLDRIYCGSSHGLCAICPDVVDEVAGGNSYNVCNSLTTLDGMNKMVETEISRNPIDTVVVEICFNTLTRDEDSEGDEGEFNILAHIDDPFERTAYFFETVEFKNYASIYSHLMLRGFWTVKRTILGTQEHEGSIWDGQNRMSGHQSMLLAEDDVESAHNTVHYYMEPREENIEKFEKLIATCREYDADIVFVVTPLADSFIWKVDDLDRLMQWYIDYGEENGIDYYDFNLLRERRELISDENSFYDMFHLEKTASDIFSTELGEVLEKRENGEDVSELFYGSYEEYKQAYPYSEYYDDAA